MRKNALHRADCLEKDVAAKERDTEALKQEHQRDTSRLKVGGPPVEHSLVLCLAERQRARTPSCRSATSRTECAAPGQGGHYCRKPLLLSPEGLTHPSAAGCSASSNSLAMVRIWQTQVLWLQACLKAPLASIQCIGVLQTQLRPLRRHQPPELVQDVKEAYEDEVTAKEERDTSEKDVRDRAAAGLGSVLCQILVWH